MDDFIDPSHPDTNGNPANNKRGGSKPIQGQHPVATRTENRSLQQKPVGNIAQTRVTSSVRPQQNVPVPVQSKNNQPAARNRLGTNQIEDCFEDEMFQDDFDISEFDDVTTQYSNTGRQTKNIPEKSVPKTSRTAKPSSMNINILHDGKLACSMSMTFSGNTENDLRDNCAPASKRKKTEEVHMRNEESVNIGIKDENIAQSKYLPHNPPENILSSLHSRVKDEPIVSVPHVPSGSRGDNSGLVLASRGINSTSVDAQHDSSENSLSYRMGSLHVPELDIASIKTASGSFKSYSHTICQSYLMPFDDFEIEHCLYLSTLGENGKVTSHISVNINSITIKIYINELLSIYSVMDRS